MGDTARFRLFTEAVESSFPDRKIAIADVASGKGRLQAALYQLGYRNVTSWDVRPKNAGPRRGYHYGRFDYRSAPRSYDLVVGMHPDEATDHIILYAIRHRKPFLVCPCCVMPSAVSYGGARSDYHDWMKHLVGLGRQDKWNITVKSLPMRGRNQVIIGLPKKGDC